MGVGKGALDVGKVRVMLKGSHVEARLFTELGDTGAVVVSQRPIGEDRISNLAEERGGNQSWRERELVKEWEGREGSLGAREGERGGNLIWIQT